MESKKITVDLVVIEHDDCAGCLYDLEFVIKNCRDIVKATTGINCSDGYIFQKPVKTYPVKTPVNSSGRIIFGEKDRSGHYHQVMDVSSIGNLLVNAGTWNNRSDMFVWVECKREDLKTGDTAYAWHKEENDFSIKHRVRKIVDHEFCYWVDEEGNILKTAQHYDYWYKLTHKEDL